jgi:hypothetical protein
MHSWTPAGLQTTPSGTEKETEIGTELLWDLPYSIGI